MSKRTIGPLTHTFSRRFKDNNGDWQSIGVKCGVWLTFDDDALAHVMGGKAFHNKSKICKEVGGLVTAEVREVQPRATTGGSGHD